MIKKNYKPRIVLIFIIFLLGNLIILARLFFMQVCNDEFYKNLAQSQYQIKVNVNPVRGQILDRTGVPIACNDDTLSAYLLPKQLNDPIHVSSVLRCHFPEAFNRLKSKSSKHFMWVERMLSAQKRDLVIQEAQEDIRLLPEPHRFYPYPELASVLGATDIDNIGISGIELMFDHSLRGESTNILLEKDARFKHFYFDKNIGKSGHTGNPVMLSVDRTLQFLVNEELKKTAKLFEVQEGSILVMNPDNGEVLVMANYPTMATQEREKMPSIEVTKNRIVTECYELGSVLKIFAALAALDEGVVQFDELIDCEGKITYINKFKVENWKFTQIEPFYEVVKKSSNVGIAKVALRLGPKLYDHFCLMGFGKKTGIEFPGERAGFVNAPKKWSRSSPIVMSFGYETMLSILHLGVAVSIIANGGYAIKPTLLKTDQPNLKMKRLYKKSSIDQIQEILANVGTRYGVSGYKVMGKTGTARIAESGGYSTKRHVYTFSGIIEKDGFRRVIVTFLKEPVKENLWAADCAGPLFQRVAEVIGMHELSMMACL